MQNVPIGSVLPENSRLEVKHTLHHFNNLPLPFQARPRGLVGREEHLSSMAIPHRHFQPRICLHADWTLSQTNVYSLEQWKHRTTARNLFVTVLWYARNRLSCCHHINGFRRTRHAFHCFLPAVKIRLRLRKRPPSNFNINLIFKAK